MAVVTPSKVWAECLVWEDNREVLLITKNSTKSLELIRMLLQLRLRKLTIELLEIIIPIVVAIKKSSKKFSKLTRFSPILKSVTCIMKVDSRLLLVKADRVAEVWEISSI